ncbi:LysR family transcriptional regulator [Gordonia sp. NPDC003424]
MNLANVDLNLLYGLHALLEESNVTRAGERIGVGQSTMSATLARLRRHYGDELLVRVGREYELTPLARSLLPQVRRTITALDRALGRVAPFDPRADQRTVTVASSDFARIELAGRFGRICAEAPGIHFDLQPLPKATFVADQDLLTYDFVIAVPGSGFQGESTTLFVDHYVCVADRNNPMIRDGSISWEDFCAAGHAQAGFGEAHHTPVQRRISELGATPRVAVRTHSLVLLPRIVAGTDLIALVPSRLASRVCSATGTVAVEAPIGRVELIEALWWHPSRSMDPAVQWLRSRLIGDEAES